MNSSKLDQELRSLALEQNQKEVPQYISKGIDDVLAGLPDRNASQPKAKLKRKRRWLQGAAAAVVLSAGIIGSGFASPSMASVLTKVPGLEFIFSASYEDVSDKQPEEHAMRGSKFEFGDAGPFNKTVLETEFFNGYTDKFKSYVGFPVPQLNSDEANPFIRVDKHGEGLFEILVFGEIDKQPVILDTVPHAVNLPQFYGESEEPVAKEKLDLQGVKADVLSYKFDDTDKTNYVVWKRKDTLFVIASTLSVDKLEDVARDIDKQASNLK